MFDPYNKASRQLGQAIELGICQRKNILVVCVIVGKAVGVL